MEQVTNFISTNYAHENLLWDERTNCHNNYTGTNRKILRKLRFNPLSIAMGIARTTSVLPIVRANYFCYTFKELNYILNVASIHKKDMELILSLYLETKYVTETGD